MQSLAVILFSAGLVAAQSGLDINDLLNNGGLSNNENILNELLGNGFFGGQDISSELFDLGGLDLSAFNWNSLDQFGSGINFNDVFSQNFDFNNQNDLFSGIQALSSGFGLGNAFNSNDLFGLSQNDELELLLEMLQLQQLLQFGQLDIGSIQNLINNELSNFGGVNNNDIQAIIDQLEGSQLNDFSNLGNLGFSGGSASDLSNNLNVNIGGGAPPNVVLDGVNVV